MAKAGRIACIFTPFALTIASLICLVLLFLAGTIQGNSTLDDLYFLKLNLTGIDTTASTASSSQLSTEYSLILKALQQGRAQSRISDYYTIYLRNYCAWDEREPAYSHCSSTTSSFWFDPITVWGLNSTVQFQYDQLPSNLRDGLKAYQKLSVALFYIYTIGLAATAVTVVVGISAIFSRWGSFVTSALAGIASTLVVIGAVMASVMFSVFRGVLRETFDQELHTRTDLGPRYLGLVWVGAAFAVVAGLFWTLSICCCSGRSPYNPGSKEARRTRAEKTPYTYERVGSPYLSQQNTPAVPLQNFSNKSHGGYAGGPDLQRDSRSAYEPFRAQQV